MNVRRAACSACCAHGHGEPISFAWRTTAGSRGEVRVMVDDGDETIARSKPFTVTG